MHEEIITNISLHLDKDESAYITKKRKTHSPNYYRVGKGDRNMKGITSIDLLAEITRMTKAEQSAFLLIRDSITWDNHSGEVYITFTDKLQQKKFLEGFKLLEKKNLVKRTKRSHYMINPAALIPLDYDAAILLWKELP